LNQTQASLNINYGNASNVNNLSTTQANVSNMMTSNVKNSAVSEQLATIRYRGCVELGIAENDILKQVTSRFMDILGEYMAVDTLGQSTLKPTIKVSDTVRKIVKELS